MFTSESPSHNDDTTITISHRYFDLELFISESQLKPDPVNGIIVD
jgi:hypothetical protein